MAQRIIARDEHKSSGADVVHACRVYSKDDYGDFHVRCYVNGEEILGYRYFTSDKQEALDTMEYNMHVIRATK